MKKTEIIMVCILTTIITIGCGNKTETAKKKSFDNLSTVRITPSEKEIMALLSVKYNVDEKIMEKLIDEYKYEHRYIGSLRQQLKDNVVMKRNLNYKNTIMSLSDKYSLPKEKVASILLDYKIYTEYISREES
jgi:subtilase family serine protease